MKKKSIQYTWNEQTTEISEQYDIQITTTLFEAISTHLNSSKEREEENKSLKKLGRSSSKKNSSSNGATTKQEEIELNQPLNSRNSKPARTENYFLFLNTLWDSRKGKKLVWDGEIFAQNSFCKDLYSEMPFRVSMLMIMCVKWGSVCPLYRV